MKETPNVCMYSRKPLKAFYILCRDVHVMDLFLLRREHRCGVTVLLLSAGKIDKDSGKVRVFCSKMMIHHCHLMYCVQFHRVVHERI